MPLAIQYGHAMLGSLDERGTRMAGVSEGAAYEERSVWCKDGASQNPNATPDPKNRFKCNVRIPVTNTSGETRWAQSGWAQVIGGQGSIDRDNYFRNGPDYDYTYGGIRAGLDVFAREQADGTLDKVGVYVGYGQLSSDIHGLSSANIEYKTGTVDMSAYTAGAYWTHSSAQGWYTDAVVQGTWYTNTSAKSVLHETVSPDGFGIIGSLEAGYQFKLGSDWTLTPQAQIAYESLSFDDARDSFGVFRFQDGESLRGRFGARLAKTWNMSDAAQPRFVTTWLRANVWHEFLGDATTLSVGTGDQSASSTPSSLKGTWGEVGAGLGAQVSKNVSLFATGDYQHSLDGKGMQGWNGKAGVSIKW